MISAIALALQLAEQVLLSAKVNGLAATIIADLEAAVTALAKVQGTEVTFEQLEGLRVKSQW
jgi:hypothetical protein